MERQSFPSQIPRRWAVGRDVRRRTSGSGAQAARPAATGIRRAGQREGREVGLGDAWRRWRAPPVPWVSQRREIWMVKSARGVSRFLLLSGRSDSGIWDMAPVQAEVTNCHHRLCFNPDPGYGKDSSTGDEKGLLGWKMAFSYQDLLGINLQMSFPTEAVSTPQKRCLRESHALLVSVTGKAKGSGSLRERETRGLGQRHPLDLAHLHMPVCPGGQRLSSPQDFGRRELARGLGLPASCKLRRLAPTAKEGAGERSIQAGRPRSPSRTPITFL